MGVVSRNTVPESVKMDLKVAYKEGRETGAKDTSWRKLVAIVPTSSDSKQMTFHGDKGRLRRWRGERSPQGFAEYKSYLKLDEWEYTVTVRRTTLDDDQTGGLLRGKVTNFANAIESSIEAEFWETLHNGSSLKGFDKANLYDFNHRYVNSSGATNADVAAQANMHLGGSQLDTTTLQLEQQHYANILSDKNKPYGGRLTHIATRRGSANSKNAREMLNSTYTVETSSVKGQMTENVFRSSFEHMEFDYGFGASEWVSFDLSDPESKPIIVLSHSVSPGINNMQYTQLLEESETGFWRNELAFGIYGRWENNVGDWRTTFLHGSSGYTFTPYDTESQRLSDPNA